MQKCQYFEVIVNLLPMRIQFSWLALVQIDELSLNSMGCVDDEIVLT